MKIGVLGSGLMGKEAARDLVNSEGVTAVGLADIDQERLQQVAKELNSPKLTVHLVNANDEEELKAYISQYDCIVNADRKSVV